MKLSKKLRAAAILTFIAIGGLQLGERNGLWVLPELISSAEAKVGRPLDLSDEYMDNKIAQSVWNLPLN